MSKKHFIALADIVKFHREAFTEEAIVQLGRFCADQNCRFNYSRWRRYINGECGPNGGKVKS